MKGLLSFAMVLLATSSLISQSIAEPPRSYQMPVGDRFGYLINGKVTYDEHVYVYGGYAEFEVTAADDESLTIHFRGKAQGSDFPDPNRKRSIGELPNALVVERGRRDRDYQFLGLTEYESTFRMSRQGELIGPAEDEPAALPFYFGDLRTIVFENLGERAEPTWETESAIAVGSPVDRTPEPESETTKSKSAQAWTAPSFGNLFKFEPYHRFDLRPATRKAQLTMQRASRDRRLRDKRTIEISYQLQSIAVEMPFDATGKTLWIVDAETFRPISLQSQTVFRVNRDGTLQPAQTTLTCRLASEAELAEYHAKQTKLADDEAARIASMRQKAQERQELKSTRMPTRAELSDAITKLDSGSYGKELEALRFLAQHPLAKKSRDVVKRLNELADENPLRLRVELERIESAWETKLGSR